MHMYVSYASGNGHASQRRYISIWWNVHRAKYYKHMAASQKEKKNYFFFVLKLMK